MNPKDLVRTGYDVISEAYRSDNADDGEEGHWLEELVALLPSAATVLDFGCGNGIPAARWLASRGYQVTGIDISPVQIQRAKRLVPNATFKCADFTSLDYPEHHFDAIVSFFAIIHVPVEEQSAVLHSVGAWLKPGGWLMATVGTRGTTGIEENWLGAGAPMYWSTTDSATFLQWMVDAGLSVEWQRFIPEGSGGHTLVLAQKKS